MTAAAPLSLYWRFFLPPENVIQRCLINVLVITHVPLSFRRLMQLTGMGWFSHSRRRPSWSTTSISLPGIAWSDRLLVISACFLTSGERICRCKKNQESLSATLTITSIFLILPRFSRFYLDYLRRFNRYFSIFSILPRFSRFHIDFCDFKSIFAIFTRF